MTAPKWHEDRTASFDVESTGTDVHNDRIVTAAVVHLTPGQRPRTLSWVIDPGVDIPQGASDIHGWTNDKIRARLGDDRIQAVYTAPGGATGFYKDRADAIDNIAGSVALAMSQGVPLIVFIAAFDLSILEAECARHSVPTLTERLAPQGVRGVIDPFVIDKHYSRRKGSRKLVDQCRHYQVMLPAAHSAGADALASARLIPRMVAAYPELGWMTLPKLHQAQIGWRHEQQTSLRAYFDRNGTPHDGCDLAWPLIQSTTAQEVPA